MAPNASSENLTVSSNEKSEQNRIEETKLKVEEKEPLGNYSDAALPILTLTFGYVCGIITCWDLPIDTRVSNWFLMDWSGTCFTLSTIYILICTVWGPRYMRGRKPYELKKTIMVYNIFQVFLSAYMVHEFGMGGWFTDYSYTCQPTDFSDSPQALRMARVSYIYFASKLFDYLDTFFFVARKKYNQITILHLIHHSFMATAMWFGMKYIPGGHQTFMGLLNSGVHTVMYFYYFLSGLGPAVQPYLWWKRYITRIQLIQFVTVFFHSMQVFFQPSCKNVSKKFLIWINLYAIIFFALFMNFYMKAYKKPKAKDDQKQDPSMSRIIPKSVSKDITRRTAANVIAHSISASS